MPLKESLYAGAGRVLRTAFPGPALGRACDRVQVTSGFPPVRMGGAAKSQILVYHRVLPEADPFSIGVVSARDFRGQMAVLRKRFRVVSLDQLLRELDGGGTLPGTMCVTFDDGYRDNHRHALPILEEFAVPATVYLATDFIGTGKVTWYDRVLLAVKHSRAERLDIGDAALPPLDLGGDTGLRAQKAHGLTAWLKGFSPEARDAYIDRILAGLGGRPPETADVMLAWDEVRDMARRGVAIGAHTMSHPILTRISPAEVDAEVSGSKRAIEAQLDAEVRLFAYPNGRPGDFDESVKQVLRKHNFACAVTTVHGVNGPHQDRMELYRRQPWENNPDSFLFRLYAERLAA